MKLARKTYTNFAGIVEKMLFTHNKFLFTKYHFQKVILYYICMHLIVIRFQFIFNEMGFMPLELKYLLLLHDP